MAGLQGHPAGLRSVEVDPADQLGVSGKGVAGLEQPPAPLLSGAADTHFGDQHGLAIVRMQPTPAVIDLGKTAELATAAPARGAVDRDPDQIDRIATRPERSSVAVAGR